MLSALAGLLFTVIIIFLAVFDLTGFLTQDAAVRPLLNRYLIGQAAGLATEEMVVNVIDHGFSKDKKDHSVDVRVVCKNDEVILRI